MTENELTHLQTNLQQLLNRRNYTDLFEELAKYPFLKGYMTFSVEFEGGSYRTDAHFVQRFATFVNNAFRDEREKLHVQLDEAILEKEREVARLDKEIGEKKSLLESLQQQIREAEGKLAQEAEAQAWFEKAKSLPADNDKILAYDKAIECKPDFAEAYFGRGKAKYEIGKSLEAIIDFSKAIVYQPDFAEAYFERGYIKSWFFLRDQESLADFTQAILLNPTYNNAYFYRGFVKKRLKMYREAIEDYEQRLEFNKTEHTSLYSIAECYSMLQDKQKVLQYLAEAILLASSYKRASKHNKAFEWLWEDADFKRLVG